MGIIDSPLPAAQSARETTSDALDASTCPDPYLTAATCAAEAHAD